MCVHCVYIVCVCECSKEEWCMCACVDVLNFPLPFLFSSFLHLCVSVPGGVGICALLHCCCCDLLCVGTLFVFMTNSGGAYLSGPYDVNYGYGGEQ